MAPQPVGHVDDARGRAHLQCDERGRVIDQAGHHRVGFGGATMNGVERGVQVETLQRDE